jgi:hypothetical protein
VVAIDTFRQIALSFPEAMEQSHFEKPSYRVNKKIFATLDIKNRQVCIKLSETDQDIFSAFDKSVIFPVPGKWGKQGWTFINLAKVRKDMFVDALTMAYCTVAPKRLSAIIKTKNKK